jgi:curved DNA-binding protein CbpA
MGNTGSQEEDPETQKYKEYIQQQQTIIEAQQRQINQQQQINRLQQESRRQRASQMQQNTFQQPNTNGMPSNVFFEQQANRQKRLNQLQKQTIEREKLNPYRIIGVSKNFTELELKKAYLRKAMKTHPDKGGSEKEFQKVSIAYTFLLNKLNETKNNHEHHELREQSQDFSQEQVQMNQRNRNLSEKFDTDVFNKIYEENKIPEVHEDGYGEWMKKESKPSLNTQKMFTGNFNKNMFHKEFDKFKQQVSKETGTQMQVYQEPEVSISYKGKDSIMVLGQKKVDNFSGQSDGGLAYRDYKDAYTNSCLIDIHSVNSKGRPKSLNEEKAQRSNISYQMNETEAQQYHLKKQKEEQEEKDRIGRLRNYEEKAFAMHDLIHQRMLGN